MSALFNFGAFLRLAVLLVCAVTYARRKFPTLIRGSGAGGALIAKCNTVGTRLSPYVAALCAYFGLAMLKGMIFG